MVLDPRVGNAFQGAVAPWRGLRAPSFPTCSVSAGQDARAADLRARRRIETLARSIAPDAAARLIITGAVADVAVGTIVRRRRHRASATALHGSSARTAGRAEIGRLSPARAAALDCTAAPT